MAQILIYTIPGCPYCKAAKELLKEKKQNYLEINRDENEKIRQEMIKKSNGRTTVPQIFINGKHIGGCDDLYDLEEQGKLDLLLKE